MCSSDLLGEMRDAPSEAVFLGLFRNEKEDAGLRLAALSALRRYSSEEIPSAVLQLYPGLQGDLQQTAQSLLASRPSWALRLLHAVDEGVIPGKSIGLDSVLLMSTYKHQETSDLIARH